ncbi:MAG: dihydrolipoamide acetyltransferase family protein [Solirubrobacterales bacterium]|nr:dihydrolipoamide acetyltransferase family protein [Solirubrobacterales bacterium]
MIDLVMPRLSDSMEEGTVLAWLVEEGDFVKRGDELVEIETDKAAMVHNSDAAGVLHIVAPVGTTLPVGAEIGQLLQEGETLADHGAAEVLKTPTEAPPLVETLGEAIESVSAAKQAPTAEPAGPTSNDRIHVSPVARRIAKALGVDLAGIRGTGPNGRIVREDIENAAPSNGETAKSAPATDTPTMSTSETPEATPAAAAPTQTAKGEVTRREPSRAQALIARRMAESRATVPDFTLETDVDASRLVDMRRQLKELDDGHGAPTVNDLVVRACALALRDHPAVNGSWRDGAFEEYARVNIGIAVATDAGLVVPVIFDADYKDIHQIAQETRELAVKAREGTITPPDLSGGTFSISNLGMFGIDRFTAVINPPQAAMLAVGSLREVPVVHDGEVVPGSLLSLTLAVDHRAVYGAPAAAFLDAVRDRLAAPAALLG